MIKVYCIMVKINLSTADLKIGTYPSKTINVYEHILLHHGENKLKRGHHA